MATIDRKPIGSKRRVYMRSSIKGEMMQKDLPVIEAQLHTQVCNPNTTIVTIDLHRLLMRSTRSHLRSMRPWTTMIDFRNEGRRH
jgi:hypothetical protein